MDKQTQTPESTLKNYFARGQKCRFRKLSPNQVKRLYFNWVKDDSDTRTFEEVFQKKFDDHEALWRKQYDLKSVKFVPKDVGEVVLEYDSKEKIAKLTFKSSRHRPLVVMKPIKTHSKLLKWVRDKTNHYCDENVVEVSFEGLTTNLKAPIITTVLLF